MSNTYGRLMAQSEEYRRVCEMAMGIVLREGHLIYIADFGVFDLIAMAQDELMISLHGWCAEQLENPDFSSLSVCVNWEEVLGRARDSDDERFYPIYLPGEWVQRLTTWYASVKHHLGLPWHLPRDPCRN